MKLYFSVFIFLNHASFASSKAFTADLDTLLSRVPRNVQNNATLTTVSLQVTSKICSRFADTLITSTMKNKSPEKQEAQFVVQLPQTAFISNFSMVVDGKLYIGLVKEKTAAEEEYETAKNKGFNAGLVSQEGKHSQGPREMDVFQIAINVAPNSSAEFRLSYQQLLERRKGFYEQTISIRPKQIVPSLKVAIDIEEPQTLSYVDVMKIRKNPSDVIEKGNPAAVVTNATPQSVHIEYSPSEDEQEREGFDGVDGDFIVR